MAKQWLKCWRGSGVVAVLITAFLLALLLAKNALPARQEAKAALPTDLAKVPSDAALVQSVRVADLWNSELAKPVRQKLTKEFGDEIRVFEEQYGLTLDQMERLTLVLLDPKAGEEPLVFFRTTKPFDRTKVLAEKKEQEYKGQTFYSSGRELAVYPLDDRALVSGSTNAIRGLIDHPTPKPEGPLAGMLRLATGKHTLTVGLNVKTFNDAFGDTLPGEAEPFKPLLRATWATLTVDVGEQSRIALKLNFSTANDAKAAIKSFKNGQDLALGVIERSMKELAKQKETTKIAQLVKQSRDALKAAQIEQKDKTLQASATMKVDAATVGDALLEGVRKTRETAARIQSASNLHNIGIAMHNYQDGTDGHFPRHATFDKNGKPMLSWRVMILPYIEHQNLYQQFHFNEPWDSEHNKKLLAKMPRVYASPQDKNTVKNHTTHYQAFVGKGTVFDGKKRISLNDIAAADGASLTLLIVEASKAVPWTKPEDLPYDAAKPLPKLGLPGASGFHALMCDGSLRFIAHKIKPKTLHCLITRNDGMVIKGSDF